MDSLQEQQKLVEAEIKKLEAMGGSFTGRARKLRDSTFSRFPLLFTMLSTFGLVATLYGFEKVIDEIDFFADKPWAVLGVGLITLLLTGALYKKLY